MFEGTGIELFRLICALFLMPVILATGEAEIERIIIECQHGQ
jgi:hypothetical protein